MYIDNGKINIDKVADDFSPYLWKIITNSGIYDINDIKDIISDTYLVLWNNQDIIDINRELAPYLIGIVRIIIKRYFSSRNNKIIENNIEDYENIIQECNDLYEVAFIDTMPEGYSDFVERMKTHGIDLENIDYAKLINSKSETEIIAEAVQKENFEAEKIIKTKSRINLFVISVCSFGIIVIIIVNINYIKKLKKRS